MRERRKGRDPAEVGHAQGGFTLVEVLVVIVILGIISGALATAFVVSARSSADTTQRFNESHDAQLASAYFATDVQSSAELTAADDDHACYAGSLTPLINFNYDRGLSVASYYYDASGSQPTLVRRFCDSGGNLAADTTLVSFAGPAPTLTCDGAPCSPATNPRPNRVRMEISEKGGYTYELSGSRRIFADADAAAPDPPRPYGRLLALGNGGLQIDPQATLNVNGTVIVNSISSNGSNFTYGTLEIVGGGTCSNCPLGYVNRVNPVADPLAGLAAPSTAELPTNPPKVGDSYFPGIYTGQFTPDGTLEPGTYILEKGMCIAGENTVVGVGVLLYITGSAACGPGTYALGIAEQGDVTLTPPVSGTYQGILVWSTTDAELLIAGTGDVGTTTSGVIYAPIATNVTLGAGDGGLFIGSIIASNIAVALGRVCVGYSSPQEC